MSARELQQLPPVGESDISHANTKLTDMQEVFVRSIVEGRNATDAARDAKYSHPEQSSYYLTKQPHIQRAIRARLMDRISSEGAPLAFTTLMEIASDKTAPKGARVQASNSILDRAGFISKALEKQRDSDDKPLSEMSASDLEQFINKLQSKIETGNAARTAEDAEYVEHGPTTLDHDENQ